MENIELYERINGHAEIVEIKEQDEPEEKRRRIYNKIPMRKKEHCNRSWMNYSANR